MRAREKALEKGKLIDTPELRKALNFFKTQLQQRYNTSSDVQNRLLIQWWPQLNLILPSAKGGQAHIRTKWYKRYKNAQQTNSHTSQRSIFN